MANKYNGPVQLVLFDVDGVLTDGKLHIGADGEMIKNFHVKDGVAVALLKAHGISSGVITAKKSAALDYRIGQLNFDVAVTGCDDKLSAYLNIKENFMLEDQQIVYVGDDVIDLSVMERVGISYAPADAHRFVLKCATHITSMEGGQGVAREVSEHILHSGGLDLNASYSPLLNKRSKNSIQQ